MIHFHNKIKIMKCLIINEYHIKNYRTLNFQWHKINFKVKIDHITHTHHSHFFPQIKMMELNYNLQIVLII
jgi:hypothetical protein